MTNEFFNILKRPDAVPTAEMVESLAAAYPFFWLPSAVLLSRAADSLDPDYLATLKSRVALFCADHSQLYRLIGENGAIFDSLYKPETTHTPDTSNAIDLFLQRYGSSDPAEEAVLQRLIFNPVPTDYASTLSDGENEESHGDDSIESLAEAVRSIRALDFADPEDITSAPTLPDAAAIPAAKPAAPPSDLPPTDSTFSESLAKIYIRQQRFDKALEIISSLSLKFPEKSVYFADQIRFLRKLILNRSYNLQQ